MNRLDYGKLKTNLRLAVNRLKLLEKKKTEMAMKARREIADYIQNGKEDRARIRVEHIIREDYLVEAMEMVEMYADLLLARFGLVQSQKLLDQGLEEPISSLIWVAPRLQADVPEFREIATQLAEKYGKEFAEYSRANKLETVNEKLMHKLGVQAPPKVLVERYMMEIAKSFNLQFSPDPAVMAEDEMFQGDSMLIRLDSSSQGGSRQTAQQHQPMAAQAGCACGGGGLPPPLPAMPPVGLSVGYPPPASHAPPYGTGYASSVQQPSVPTYNGGVEPPAPPYSALYNGPGGPGQPQNFRAGPLPPKNDIDLPDLPAVPGNLPNVSRPDQSNSVDFDDLTRRFEELKKKK